MNFESIPKEDAGWESLQQDLNIAFDSLDEHDPLFAEIIKITTGTDLETADLTEKYLKDNFNRLSQEQKTFLLSSLRVKNYRHNSKK